MKKISVLTAALIALGLVSHASASTTVTVGGTTYNEVFITGSTAFRPNLFAALTSTSGTTNVFDATPAPVTQTPNSGGAASGSSSVYEVIGNIGGVPYIVNVSLTGSEAGLASLARNASGITYTIPANSELTGYSSTTVTLAGTPNPTFIDPTSSTFAQTQTAPADLAFADTSSAVSLSSTASFTDYGIVGVIPFTWAKGVNTLPDSSWSDLLNVTQPQLLNVLNGTPQARLFTGVAGDTDKTYLIGRNKGSGTRVNMEADLFATIGNGISQYAINNATYASGGNVLTAGSAVTLTSNSTGKNNTQWHLVGVGNDGFDSGGGVKNTLNSDIHGVGVITLGYLGLSDAEGLTSASLASSTGAGQWLTLDGVPENDANVINGTYSFWGHEHFYGVASSLLSSSASTVGSLLAGSTINEGLQGFSANGAIEFHGNLSVPPTGFPNNSTAINPTLMHADKPAGADIGYPNIY